jgi:hypothetical protein
MIIKELKLASYGPRRMPFTAARVPKDTQSGTSGSDAVKVKVVVT